MASLSLLVSKGGQIVAVYSTAWTNVIWWHHPMFYSNWYSNLYLFLYIHSRACLRSLNLQSLLLWLQWHPNLSKNGLKQPGQYQQCRWNHPLLSQAPSLPCPARLRILCCHQVHCREQGQLRTPGRSAAALTQPHGHHGDSATHSLHCTALANSCTHPSRCQRRPLAFLKEIRLIDL